MSTGLEKLEKHAMQVAAREECFLYDLELVGTGKSRILRIFIDKEGEEGVSVDDCSNVSRGLGLLLDVEDIVPGGSYQLEVSSPGLERHLSKDWHYTKAKGEKVIVQLKTGLGQFQKGLSEKESRRKKVSGQIVEADEEGVSLSVEIKDMDAFEVKIPYEHVHKSKVVFEYDKLYKQQKKKK